MARDTTYLQLRSWNLTTDQFSHTDLDNNWEKIDKHNHAPLDPGDPNAFGGQQIPTAGLQNASVTGQKILDGTITGAKLQDSTIPSTKIIPSTLDSSKVVDGTLTAAKMNPDVFSPWRTVFQGQAKAVTGLVAGTYYLLSPEGTHLASGAVGTAGCAHYINSGDYKVGTRTTYVRIVAGIITNAANPGGNVTFDLQRVVAVGGVSGTVPYVVAMVAAPAATTSINGLLATERHWQANPNPSSFGSTGLYAVQFTPSVTWPVGSYAAISYRVEARQQ